jgi:hypothetical protein
LNESSRRRGTICPSWCQLPPGHVAGSRDTGETTHIRLVQEVRLGEIEAIRGGADQTVRVAIEAFTDPDGREYAPTIRLTLSSASSPDPDADDLTPAEARKLAGALLEAARLAESLAYPGGCGDPAIQRAAAPRHSLLVLQLPMQSIFARA